MQTVHLNGDFLPADKAVLSPFDRGFLFAHAAYEVTAVYNHQLIDFKNHTTRLFRTLDALGIPNPHSDLEWLEIHRQLMARNHLQEGLIYLQVSAGAYGERDFAGPESFVPTIFLFVSNRPLIGDTAQSGIRAITLEDTRWTRRDLKTTQLLSQALAYRAARDQGCETAIMIEDGKVTEAASASVFLVGADGTLRTRELSNAVLPSITREQTLELLADTGMELVEGAFEKNLLSEASEAFTTSAGALIAPVIEIDGAPVGSGAPGPITRKIQRLYYQHMGADLSRFEWLSV